MITFIRVLALAIICLLIGYDAGSKQRPDTTVWVRWFPNEVHPIPAVSQMPGPRGYSM